MPHTSDRRLAVSTLGVKLSIGASGRSLAARNVLKPELVYYNCYASTQREADETLQWLKANT